MSRFFPSRIHCVHPAKHAVLFGRVGFVLVATAWMALILAASGFVENAFAQTQAGIPYIPPGVETDPSDRTRGFDPKTGENFYWDKSARVWRNTKTGKAVGSYPAFLGPGTPAGRESECKRREIQEPQAKPEDTTKPKPKSPAPKSGSTPGGAKPRSSVTPPRVVPPIRPGRTTTGRLPSSGTATGPIDSCLVGKWRSESVTSELTGMAAGGGSGILVTFKSDGTQVIDYNGMQPLRGTFGETNQWSGTAAGHISTSNGTATIESVEQSDLMHKYLAPDGTSSSNSMGRTLGPAGLVNNPLDRSYTCTKDTLIYKDPAHTFTFKRMSGQTRSKAPTDGQKQHLEQPKEPSTPLTQPKQPRNTTAQLHQKIDATGRALLEDYLFQKLCKALGVRPSDLRDPSDHTRAFDTKTGRNFHWDDDQLQWIDSKTGEGVGDRGSEALLEDYLFQKLCKALGVRPSDLRDPSDHTRAFDTKTGRNFHWDHDKLDWIDSKTGEGVGRSLLK